MRRVGKKVVSREFRVTIAVEEVEAPKAADSQQDLQPLSQEAQEFLDEEDYSPG